MKYVLFIVLLLSGCATQAPPIVLPPIEIPEPKFIHPSLPSPVDLEAPDFFILTSKNALAHFENSSDGSAFAVSAQGYSILASDIQELRRYILQLQEVIISYRKLLSADSPNE